MPNDEACFARSIVRDFQATVDPKAAAHPRFRRSFGGAQGRFGNQGRMAYPEMRAAIALAFMLAGWEQLKQDPENAARITEIRDAFRSKRRAKV